MYCKDCEYWNKDDFGVDCSINCEYNGSLCEGYEVIGTGWCNEIEGTLCGYTENYCPEFLTEKEVAIELIEETRKTNASLKKIIDLLKVIASPIVKQQEEERKAEYQAYMEKSAELKRNRDKAMLLAYKDAEYIPISVCVLLTNKKAYFFSKFFREGKIKRIQENKKYLYSRQDILSLIEKEDKA